MSETPGKYYVHKQQSAHGNRKTDNCLLVTAYYKQVAVFAEAFVTAGATEIEDIADNAVALTNRLIEKIEEEKRSNS